ncbi:SusC/RagA family TonB-linked outer membrane protein [Hymenobacter rubidus]|uniref:SusC/RagA family TonB-linked outer membrane protein n=1 Tax=Hymenobacter rubidus TaxID=1441626 RepID=UPI00191E2B41|nr:SusC/RagA family TonB-linked outer membrane protein [Hymenobacter rubidus]
MKKLLFTGICLQAGLLVAVAPAQARHAAATRGPGTSSASTSGPQRVQATIQGTVTDKATGEPLEIVTVINKQNQKSTATNSKGVFTIEVDNPATDVLVFSYVGYQTMEVPVNGRSSISLQLEPTSTELKEVVVNALGFVVEKDKLGYASSKVSGSQVANSGEVGVIDALGGKASGVRISRSSGADPGAASQILIRGQSTITRGTDPLIVLDGVPINSGTRGEASSGVTQQNRLSDINPDDIASVEVLKGASAAALWGTRAANGVLMITTKKGSSDRLAISFKSTYSVDQVNRNYTLQDIYGQGTGGVWRRNNARSWGDKIANRSGAADVLNTTGEYFRADNGNLYYPITTKNSQETFNKKNYDAVFGLGHYLDNSVSLSGGNKESNYFFSLSDLNQKGVIKGNSDYRRTTARLNATRQLSKWLSISGNSSYALTNSNRVRRGVNNGSTMLGLLRTPADFDNTDYKGSYAASPTGALITDRQRAYRNSTGNTNDPGFNNPLWTTHQEINTSKVNRFINSAEINVNPTSWLHFTTRAGVDYFTDEQIGYFPVNSKNVPTGSYTRDQYSELQFNLDVIGRAEHRFSENIAINGLVGFNYNQRRNTDLTGTGVNFIIPNAPADLNNSAVANTTLDDSFIRQVTDAGYATVGGEFYNQLYVNLTGRLEAASTFGDLSPNQFFYPAADIAWDFSTLPAFQGNKIFSFGKLRASFGIVGIQPATYNTTTYFIAPNFIDDSNPNLDGSLFGTGTYVQSQSKGNPYLRPEKKQELEVGTDLRFFDNKLRAGFTAYFNKTTDALLSIPQASSTGFTSLYANAGSIQNRGVEVDLSYAAVQEKDWSLTFDANWTRNRNKVLSLNGASTIDLGGLTGVSSRAVVGQALGALWGTGWARDEAGNMILDANGFPTSNTTQQVLGDPNPDWRAGAGFTARYKGFSLHALFEHSQGGDIVDATEAVLLDYGTSAATAVERTADHDLKTSTGTVIKAGTPFRGNIQNFGAGDVALTESWYTGLGGYFGNVLEPFVQDATWTRLREITLGYTYHLPSARFGLKGAGIEFSGRNLWLISGVKNIDPDSNLAGSGSGRGIVYFNNPSTRSYLATLRLDF